MKQQRPTRVRSALQILSAITVFLGLIYPVSGRADDSASPPVTDELPVLIEEYRKNPNQGTVHIYDACYRSPREAQAVMVRYVHDHQREVRRLAIEVICTFDPAGNLPDVVRALEEPIPVAIAAIRSVEWKAGTESLRAEARRYLSHWVEQGGRNCAISLGAIGTADDIPVLRSALERALRGEVELSGSQVRLQREWEGQRQGKSPLEDIQLDFRQAMAALGDETQLAFFRSQLLGTDLVRAMDALERTAYIRQPDLAEAVAHWLPGELIAKGGPSDVTEAGPALLAIDGLEATFPGVGPLGAYGERQSFWMNWSRQHSASALPTREPDVRAVDPRGTPEVTSVPEHLPSAQSSGSKAIGSVDSQARYSVVNGILALLSMLLGIVVLRAIVVNKKRSNRSRPGGE